MAITIIQCPCCPCFPPPKLAVASCFLNVAFLRRRDNMSSKHHTPATSYPTTSPHHSFYTDVTSALYLPIMTIYWMMIRYKGATAMLQKLWLSDGSESLFLIQSSVIFWLIKSVSWFYPVFSSTADCYSYGSMQNVCPISPIANKGSWNFELEKSLSGFHFHMVIKHLRRLLFPPPPHTHPALMLITGLVWLMSLCLTYFKPLLNSVTFSSEKADELQRQKTDESSWLCLLSGWGRRRHSFFSSVSIALSSQSEPAGGSPLSLQLKGLAVIGTKALSSSFFSPWASLFIRPLTTVSSTAGILSVLTCQICSAWDTSEFQLQDKKCTLWSLQTHLDTCGKNPSVTLCLGLTIHIRLGNHFIYLWPFHWPGCYFCLV